MVVEEYYLLQKTALMLVSTTCNAKKCDSSPMYGWSKGVFPYFNGTFDGFLRGNS